MGQSPLEIPETSIDIHENLKELSRQMEEVNSLSKEEEQVDLGKNQVTDRELDLNVEPPADSGSMEILSEEVDGSGVSTTDNLSKTESFQEGADSPEEASKTASDSMLDQDEIGIDIEDDELWDEGEAEEIPLFEEELLSEITKDEEEKQQDQKDLDEEEGEEQVTSDTEEVQAGEVQKTKGRQEDEDVSAQADDGQTVSQGVQDGESDNQRPQTGLMLRLLPWLITGLSSIFVILAIFAIWSLWKSPLVSDQRHELVSEDLKHKVSNKRDILIHGQSPAKMTMSQHEAIDLAPFIIPGKSGGELVFFKLKVELVVPDATTKQELLRRQAWLRDIIYQELKGLDISRGVQGDILGRYRTPLLSRLNREFSPLKIEDIRLMGYLLR